VRNGKAEFALAIETMRRSATAEVDLGPMLSTGCDGSGKYAVKHSVYFPVKAEIAVNQRLSRKTLRERQPGYRRLPPQPRPKELPRPNVFFVALVVTVGVLGLMSTFAVGHTLYEISSIAERQEILRTLPDLRDAAQRETVILDGRIAAAEPARYKEFVAYIRERKRGGGPRSVSWIEIVDQAKPAFAVDTGTRVYKLANTNYSFDRLIGNWTDHRRVDEGPTTFRNAITIEGIVAGSPVMAVGRHVSGEQGALDFHAESVVGLSRAAYIDRLERARVCDWWLAGILALVAPILLYFSWRGVRRVMGWPRGRAGR
jgi:hypothetical protein